jgi:Fic family protein
MRIRGGITSSEYLKVMNVSERTARNHLKRMVDLGLLRVEGEGKATKYVINH